MLTRVITISGFAGTVVALTLLEILARRERSGIPTIGQCFGYLMRPRIGRILVLLAWWWLGWHLLAR